MDSTLTLKGQLTDFVSMTNFCEDLGYEFEMIQSKKGITCDLWKDGELLKVGSNIYETCIEAQKEVYTKLYYALIK